MEILGAYVDEEWDSLSKMFSENPDSFLHYDDQNVFLPSDHFNANFSSFSRGSSNTTSDQIETAIFPNQYDYNVTNNTFESMNYYNMDSNNHGLIVPVFSDDAMEEILQSKGENRAADDSCQLKRKYEENHSQESSPKKIPRVSRNRKNKKKMQEENNEEEGGNRQSSSSCSSEDDSNDSKPKTKASRGSATDPQSLYARKRRERINERLKILQNLVPNGTKVDISTMLEEAVQYVKFLQLQIKLLSSDDMWMYAPLAYNGMDIGIYQNIPQI